MTRDRFRDLFILATERVLEFTRTFVIQEIPETPRYRVRCNKSHDVAHDGTSLTAFPQDSLPGQEFHGPWTGVAVIDFLWRDGRVPQWIDVSVVDVEGDTTFIELYCCGRYVAEEERMYYSPKMGPFGVKGPPLPPSWDDKKREKFDLHWSALRKENK
ncbi:MAG: hypothetical protein ACKVP0_18570 [Pirellulaceae bacterium]